PISAAICLLRRPRTTNPSTSCSRDVSDAYCFRNSATFVPLLRSSRSPLMGGVRQQSDFRAIREGADGTEIAFESRVRYVKTASARHQVEELVKAGLVGGDLGLSSRPGVFGLYRRTGYGGALWIRYHTDHGSRHALRKSGRSTTAWHPDETSVYNTSEFT